MKKNIVLVAIPFIFSLLIPAAWASTDAPAMIDEGNKLWSENKTVEAEASYKKAIAADPESAIAYSRLGALMLMQNRGLEAVDAYQAAITKAPDNASYFAALSIAYLHMGYHEMALTMANQAAKLDPDMKHAKDISKYIDAKLERMAEASTVAPDTGNEHGSASLHGAKNSDSTPH